jgi:hypothetical protein
MQNQPILERALARAAIALASLVVIGCEGTPALTPNIVGGRQPWDVWLSSPIVVVGKVTRLTPLGATSQFSSDEGGPFPVKLWSVELEVEKTLEGRAPTGMVTVLAFLFEPGVVNYVGVKPYTLRPGDRKVFFLRRENGYIRLFSDVYSLDISVYTGRPNNSAYDSSVSTGDRILSVYLTPGENPDLKGLASEIIVRFGPVSQFASPRKAVALLRRLTTSDSEAIRHSACLVLAEHFPSEIGCLEGMMMSGDNAFKEKASRILTTGPDRLILTLQHNPFSIGDYQRLDYAREMIELLSEHPDARVRLLSCGLLSEFQLQVPYPNCPQSHPGRDARPK